MLRGIVVRWAIRGESQKKCNSIGGATIVASRETDDKTRVQSKRRQSKTSTHQNVDNQNVDSKTLTVSS